MCVSFCDRFMHEMCWPVLLEFVIKITVNISMNILRRDYQTGRLWVNQVCLNNMSGLYSISEKHD